MILLEILLTVPGPLLTNQSVCKVAPVLALVVAVRSVHSVLDMKVGVHSW